MDVEAQERKLILLALRIANTYCNLAEAHALCSHRTDALRALQKAEKEIANVERRLDRNKTLFGTETASVKAQSARLKKRIQSLDSLAA